MQKFPYDKKHLPFGHSGAVLDQEVMNFLNMMPLRFTEHMYDVNVTEEYSPIGNKNGMKNDKKSL